MPVNFENLFAATTIPRRRTTQAVESLDHQFERMKPTAPESEFKFRILPQCVEDTTTSLELTASFLIRLRLLVTEKRNKPRWCFRHEPISSTKISKTLRKTVIDRIHKLGPSKSVEMIGESPAQSHDCWLLYFVSSLSTSYRPSRS